MAQIEQRELPALRVRSPRAASFNITEDTPAKVKADKFGAVMVMQVKPGAAAHHSWLYTHWKGELAALGGTGARGVL